jgi:KUP system potassium uptake protein
MRDQKILNSSKEVIRAMGIVFGDIGTSPIYTLTIIFLLIEPNKTNVMGILSLIFWTLIFVVTIQYSWLAMNISSKGEGGIIVLRSVLLKSLKKGRRFAFVTLLGYIGIALLLGDGVLTPAISILSAVEGIELIPNIGNVSIHTVIIITIIITILLFAVQSLGVKKIASTFGPVMVIWFVMLFSVGIYYLFSDLSILLAINPLYAIEFFKSNGLASFFILSDVILCATGGEALYADMGHLGRKPIRSAWSFVLIALVINYFGQGVFLLQGHEHNQILFGMVHEFSEFVYIPFLLLALYATIIASQAMISAIMSLVYQGINLRIFPIMKIKYTSTELKSQIYIGAVNWLLLCAVILMILIFQNSENISAAYGLAVTATMTISALFLIWIFKNSGNYLKSIVSVLVLLFDIVFMLAVFTKIPNGGYWSLILAFISMVIIQIWIRGVEILSKKFRSISLDTFLESFRQVYKTESKLKGEAIYFTREFNKISPYIVHCIIRSGIMYEKNHFVSISIDDSPFGIQFSEIEKLSDGLYRTFVTLGYMEVPDLPKLFKENGFKEKVIFYGADEIVTKKPIFKVFAFLKKMSPSFANFYNFPYNKLHGVVTRYDI